MFMSTPIGQHFSRPSLIFLIFASLANSSEIDYQASYLTGVLRQLDVIERLAEDSARLPRDDTSRYHFDYARFRDDLQRMRQGIRDHLSPQRAQPRDPLPLQGDYRRETEVAGEPEL